MRAAALKCCADKCNIVESISMSLRNQMLLNILLITVVTLSVVVGWAATTTRSAIDQEIRSTEARVAYNLERLYMVRSIVPGSSLPTRTSIEMLPVMAPGTCIEFSGPALPQRRVCSGWSVFGKVAPEWFRNMLSTVFSPIQPRKRQLTVHSGGTYTVETSFDHVAAATRVWGQLGLAINLAVGLTLMMLFLTALSIFHALRPVDGIVRGLNRLADGDYATKLPAVRTQELDRISAAVNELAVQLHTASSERALLTRKLVEVQDAERKTLARELHDEFGQSLTAAGALAASIAKSAGSETSEVSADARTIGRIVQDMMLTLRNALVRLRPPDLDEVGLEDSVRSMLSNWNETLRGKTNVSLSVLGYNRTSVPPDVALGIYRIVQECVTNATRHGSPSRIAVELAHRENRGNRLWKVTVDDDGGGPAATADQNEGYGLLGIRERVTTFGGKLSIKSTSKGMRVEATIPALANGIQDS
jgi:two-component system sensor histidine kinase UhpB